MATTKKASTAATKTTSKSASTSKSLLSSLAGSAAKTALSSLTGSSSSSSGTSLKDTLTNAALQTVISQFNAKAASGSDSESFDIAGIVTKLTTLFSAKNLNYTSIANVVAQVFNAGFKQGKNS